MTKRDLIEALERNGAPDEAPVIIECDPDSDDMMIYGVRWEDVGTPTPRPYVVLSNTSYF